jgi:cytochrome c peroxidase
MSKSRRGRSATTVVRAGGAVRGSLLALRHVLPVLVAVAAPAGGAAAQEVEAIEAPPALGSLRGIAPPGPPAEQYAKLVKDRRWLVVLGKALFWDSAIGSDGQACASCHFHAGADPRTVNQLSPGLLAQPFADDRFGGTEPAAAVGKTAGGRAAAPNLALRADDFPFHKLADPTNRNSRVLYDTNDVVSSQGVFDGALVGVDRRVRFRNQTRDLCHAGQDTIFTVNIAGQMRKVRKVPGRNTPSAVNAAYYYRNFWDGRASNVFNGVDPFGLDTVRRDPAARIVTASAPGLLRLEALQLENMSLASQAVGPPNNAFEMACAGRSFADLGRKVLARTPLAEQKIATTDSVLGAGAPLGSLITPATGKGLRTTYLKLVQSAFQDRLWAGAGTYRIGSAGQLLADPAGHSQAELNFSLFFGLALDAYERTLISDQTPFDRYEEGDRGALTAQQRRGLELFTGKGKCAACHDGPLLSSAAVPPRQRSELVEPMAMADGGTALYDGGFYNIGVRPTFEDVGVGDKNPWGLPLAFARRLARGDETPDRLVADPSLADSWRVAVDGAFKTPSLRNVALTAPYFHNGGERSLADVVRFYNRGGNRRDIAGGDTTGTGPLGQTAAAPGLGGSNLAPDIERLHLGEPEIAALVAFLQALTDPRVACHAAPFDHPELIVSNGSQLTGATTRAKDAPLRLREVGRAGYRQAWCDPNTGDLFSRNLVGGMLEKLP